MSLIIHSYKERYATLSLASIYALRILSIFMILPIFSIFAHTLQGATPKLIGLAFGIYGLTQAVFQIPFGILSDRFNRKLIISIGLLIFALGSCVTALSHTISLLIVGRALQGTGAIGAALSALVADLTQEENRLKSLSFINIGINVAFSIAIIISPFLNNAVGMRGVLWLTAVLSLLAIVILFLLVPHPRRQIFHYDAEPRISQFFELLHNPELLRLNIGAFVLNAILTATFMATPIVLMHHGLPEKDQGWLYLPTITLAFFLMVPFVVLARKKRFIKQIFVGSVITLIIVQILLYALHHHVFIVGILLLFFFTAFTILEACLPSLISKIAPAGTKGSAIGLYTSAQFLGIFIGGVLGGVFYNKSEVGGIFLLCTLLGIIWLLVCRNMHAPRQVSSYMLNVGKLSKSEIRQLHNQLTQIPGVTEVAIIDGIAYLKIDTEIINPKDLHAFSSSQSLV